MRTDPASRMPLSLTTLLGLAVALVGSAALADAPQRLRGVVIGADAAEPQELERLAEGGWTAVALALTAADGPAAAAERDAARRIARSPLALYYWIEIGRSPELADARPEWMASLQGHSQWRRFFPDAPRPAAGQVVKNYPWTPILYQEVFDAQRERVARLLADKPPAAGILLNDLQGPPSACGCGNPLCRWTADYGPIRTATPLGNDAAARFVASVRQLAPQSTVIPVWASECERADDGHEALCAGVNCFRGECWRSYTAQLEFVQQETPLVGSLLLYDALWREPERHGTPAEWIEQVVRSFAEMPERHGRTPLAPERLIGVLEGWRSNGDELRAQIARLERLGAAGYFVARIEIDQRWEPKLYGP